MGYAADRLLGLVSSMIMFLLTPIVLPIAALAGLRQKAVRKAIAKETRCSH